MGLLRRKAGQPGASSAVEKGDLGDEEEAQAEGEFSRNSKLPQVWEEVGGEEYGEE